MGAWIPLFVGIVVVLLCVLLPLALPSSPNREYGPLPHLIGNSSMSSLFKVCFVLTLVCCYTMYMSCEMTKFY